MRELVLILPDLFSLDTAAAVGRPFACTALRFAPARAVPGGWRSVLARGLGREELALIEPASTVAAAADAPLDAWLATPLHWVAGLTSVHLPEHGQLRLASEELNELARAFADEFARDGLALRPLAGDTLLLEGLTGVAATTAEPVRLYGQSVYAQLPSGLDANLLRQLMSEIEMWLHGLPLNQRRSARGLPSISTLWLWGGGAPPRNAPAVAAAEPRWSLVCSDDVWVASCAALAQAVHLPLPTSFDVVSEAAARHAAESVVMVTPTLPQGLAHIEQCYLAAAAAALADGRLERLTLVTPDRACSVHSGDRWRWWRPRREWWSVLTEQA